MLNLYSATFLSIIMLQYKILSKDTLWQWEKRGKEEFGGVILEAALFKHFVYFER